METICISANQYIFFPGIVVRLINVVRLQFLLSLLMLLLVREMILVLLTSRNIYYSKSRLRRDATDSESKVSQTESQDATEVSKPTVNTDAAASIPSKDQHETVGSPKGQKTQKIETVTFSDHLHDNDSLWETVDQADTVINKTFDENIDKKANQTWKVTYSLGSLREY